MKPIASWKWELRYHKKGYARIAGIDEVGRGAWAGPIVAVAYMFLSIPTDIALSDSKILTSKQRQTCYAQLMELGVYGIGQATSREIDDLGLQQAQYMAYHRALDQLPAIPEIVLLDGLRWKDCPIEHEAVVNGDALIASIAAASIIAKVFRDTLMQTTVHERYPEYKFNEHVGYGTKSHRQAIEEFGLVPVHRLSYKPFQSMRHPVDTGQLAQNMLS